MKGFEVNEIAREFISRIDEKTFKSIVMIIRSNFPNCDFYTGTLGGGKKVVIIGSKSNPVLKLGKKDIESYGEWIYLHKDRKQNNAVDRLKEEVEKNINKSMLKSNSEYYFSIDNFDTKQFTTFIKAISNSDFIRNRMNGNKSNPDDYLKENNNSNQLPEKTSEQPSGRVRELPTSTQTVYPRDGKLADDYLQNMEYICEIDDDHRSFISSKTGSDYVEAHHLIPVSKWSEFKNELDKKANLVSLCPNCHRQLHYGNELIVKPILEKLYLKKITGLKKVGLNCSLEMLFSFYFKSESNV